jgi:hypothetical protein
MQIVLAGYDEHAMKAAEVVTLLNQTLAEEQGAEKKLRVIAAGLLKVSPVEA